MDSLSIIDLLVSLTSSFIGVDLKRIKKALNRDTANTSISEKIDAVCKNLDQSKEVIETTLAEIEKQKKEFEQLKQEAELSQKIANMNKEEIEALNQVLEATLDKQEKKAMPKTIGINIVFCVASAVLGAVLGFVLSRVWG